MARRVVRCIEGHTEGMPVRMVVDGAPSLNGESMAARRAHFAAEHDDLRRSLVLEPRGNANMSGTIFYPPLSDNADFSLLFIETSGCLPMCGHATLGSIVFLLEEGLVTPRTPGQVVIDVPAGQVRARYCVDKGKVRASFLNVPAFLLHRDVALEFPPLGRLQFDIAYGGNFYPIIEAQENYPGCEHFSPNQLLSMGRELCRLINEQMVVQHPDRPDIQGVRHCMWGGATIDPASDARAVVIAGNSLVDRSPCGTGTSARVAQRVARGLLAVDQPFVHESMIGSRFIGTARESLRLQSGLDAVIPEIAGDAWITGHASYIIDDTQPWWDGYAVDEFQPVGSTKKGAQGWA